MEAKSNEDRFNLGAQMRDIIAAQSHHSFWIGGREYQRILFQAERDKQEASPRCPDCGVSREQYHVPGCAEEICPVCGGEVIVCDCAYGVR